MNEQNEYVLKPVARADIPADVMGELTREGHGRLMECWASGRGFFVHDKVTGEFFTKHIVGE